MILRAFNLVPGAVFSDEDIPGVAVAVRVSRDESAEQVYVTWVAHGEDIPDASVDTEYTDRWNYCDNVILHGLCVDPGDSGDTDFGVEEPISTGKHAK